MLPALAIAASVLASLGWLILARHLGRDRDQEPAPEADREIEEMPLAA
jgi:hypothetical protein